MSEAYRHLMPSEMERLNKELRAQRDYLVEVVAGRIAWEPPPPILLSADASCTLLLEMNRRQAEEITALKAELALLKPGAPA